MAELFKDQKLLRNEGESLAEVNVDEALGGKIVALYFSAHWCPPCRKFTPVLKEFYEKLSDQPFEVVFVSFDHSEEDQKQYLAEAHGKWCFLPFGNSFIQQLSEKYEVSGIPDLLVIKANGDVIDREARSKVESSTETPAEELGKWKQSEAEPVPGSEPAPVVEPAPEPESEQPVEIA